METLNLRNPRRARQMPVARVTPIAGYVVVGGKVVAPALPMVASLDVRRKIAIAANSVQPCVSTALRTMVATRANLAALYRK